MPPGSKDGGIFVGLLAAFATSQPNAGVELESNLLIVMTGGVCAVDVLLQVEKDAVIS